LAGPATTEGAVAAAAVFAVVAGKAGALMGKLAFGSGPELDCTTNQTSVPKTTKTPNPTQWIVANFDALDFRFMPENMFVLYPNSEARTSKKLLIMRSF
jgi:hypothetical protein